MTNPKAFISYSWTSLQHAEWVVQLGTQLRESGVDVILDKWDLKEGHDALAFMEKMVADPEIKKVVVVLDREYVEKADGRKGGVGTETQIISAEVYKKTDQNKFVAVIAERDAEGKPHLPIYYKSRIYIDLSDPDSYANNFDQLLRWVYDKPLHVKPDLGKPPEFLTDDAISLPTRSRARRAIELARIGGAGAAGALDEYLLVVGGELEKFRITKNSREPFDDLMIKNIATFLPYRDEYIEVLSTVVRYWPISDVEQRIHKFLEKIATYLFRPTFMTSWSDTDFDNFYFIVHEIFLYTVTILLRQERFAVVSMLLSADYYLGDSAESRSSPMESFGIFRQYAKSFEIRNQRLALRRLSVRADLLEQRSQSSGLPFKLLMQADFLLFLRGSVSALKNNTQQWWPETLLYAGRHNGPFEIFARAQSAAYFERIKPMIGVSSREVLQEVLSKFSLSGNTILHTPRWDMNYIEPSALSGANELASRP
jgi:hypothetical protein